MTCRDVVPLIRDYVDRELAAQDAGRVKAHIAECSSCAGRAAEERDLKRAIRSRVKSGPAPAGLADVITRQIREQSGHRNQTTRKPVRRGVLIAAGVAMAFLLGGVGTWIWVSQPKMEQRSRATSQLVAKLVDDHIRYLSVVDPAEYAASNRSEAEEWFSSKLDISLVLPEFDAQTMVMSGVRLCHVLDRRVGLLFYEREKQRLSLFVMSDSGLDFIGMDPADLSHAEHATETYKGYRVVCWKKAGLLYALVSEQRRNDLIDFVVETYRQ